MEEGVKIGKRGKKSSYSLGKLGDPDNYTISYHLSVKSKRQEMANLAEFAGVYDKLPLTWSLPNILMADDPSGIINDLEIQRAKNINPALSLLEMAMRYAREGSEAEDETDAELKKQQSKILTHEYVMMMKQRLTPQPPPAPVEEPKGNTQMLSAMAIRGQQGEAGPAQQPVGVTNER